MGKVFVEISNLVKKFGSFSAVDDISLSLESGEVFTFLGVNGAGKTTTLRMLAGILRPTAGKIEIDGLDIVKDSRDAKRITGYIPDMPYVYAKLTGREFLNFVAELYDVEKKKAEKKIEELLFHYKLTPWADELLESYSHGMKQRLVTCSALLHSPKFLIVDEPMVGLDPHGAKLLKESLRSYAKEEGLCVILSTHSLNVAQEVSDRLAIIHKGKILELGTFDELQTAANCKGGKLEDAFIILTQSADEKEK